MLQPSVLRSLAKLSLYCVFLVILAGSIVRVTGSGMGCPDWPKCFGYYIPPVNESTLVYTADHHYQKGQMVILNDTLWRAKLDFSAGALFDRSQWEKYPKHNYAIFNPMHTWVEYINRLATVVLGLPCAILFGLTIVYAFKRKDRVPMYWSAASMLMLLFEAWLGKLVVDGNLIENSITYHMLGSLVLLLSLLALIQYLQPERNIQVSNKSLWLGTGFAVLCFVQIILGTQVREEIDVLNKSGMERSFWMDNMTMWFYIHRSFSILMIIVFGLWLKDLHQQNLLRTQIKALILVLGLEITVGIVLAYLGVPAFAQPMHLFFGTVLFSIAVAWRFRARKSIR
jgi:heme a synthase